MSVLKYIDAKITAVNGQVSISWRTDDNNWQPPAKFDIPDDIVQDIDALKLWIQNYKDSYNAGKDVEAAAASIPEVPADVTALINKPLNLA